MTTLGEVTKQAEKEASKEASDERKAKKELDKQIKKSLGSAATKAKVSKKKQINDAKALVAKLSNTRGKDADAAITETEQDVATAEV